MSFFKPEAVQAYPAFLAGDGFRNPSSLALCGESGFDTFLELSYNFAIYLSCLRNCGKLLEFSRWKALMALGIRSKRRLTFSRLVSVSICLCAFGFLPLPQLAVLTWVESAERECPCQKDGERSEQEVVPRLSARRLDDRRHSDLSRPHETGDQFRQIASCTGRLPAIVGHQLANGLCAPLLI